MIVWKISNCDLTEETIIRLGDYVIMI